MLGGEREPSGSSRGTKERTPALCRWRKSVPERQNYKNREREERERERERGVGGLDGRVKGKKGAANIAFLIKEAVIQHSLYLSSVHASFRPCRERACDRAGGGGGGGGREEGGRERKRGRERDRDRDRETERDSVKEKEGPLSSKPRHSFFAAANICSRKTKQKTTTEALAAKLFLLLQNCLSFLLQQQQQQNSKRKVVAEKTPKVKFGTEKYADLKSTATLIHKHLLQSPQKKKKKKKRKKERKKNTKKHTQQNKTTTTTTTTTTTKRAQCSSAEQCKALQLWHCGSRRQRYVYIYNSAQDATNASL